MRVHILKGCSNQLKKYGVRNLEESYIKKRYFLGIALLKYRGLAFPRDDLSRG